MGGPPGPKAPGTHNGFQVGFQVDTTGNTTLCNPVAPPLWLPCVPLVNWTFALTASKDLQKTEKRPFLASPSRPWTRRSTSPGVTRRNHNEVTGEDHTGEAATTGYYNRRATTRKWRLTWTCWLNTKCQLVGFYVKMTSSQKVPVNIKIHQHIPTPTWHLPGTYPAHEF